ncbi:SIR2 family protein [Idiomarina abyssalis]|uniref:SIR2 family protein n=1 Tax=Idiomarina abyssalis TaxID=86102 RepID=A0A8I1KFJ5_9GAMM|nr:SIR2 family protein [Idiomarina abyssalis]KPD22453.1 hypothetical protein ADS78_01845 [Idiomarina abyssalis]MBJ7266342.1 SIR2 family protein [Idiomarina abyssalis]MBJ7273542.1 SIR2 family protein [Idiomarina abyssalis]MBJ7317026.1 SIR2 family protein [Idiomarina abyssalis]SFT41184.1 SIR2-like domain-containing protein [Idiomarina abyssalis]
MDKVVYILGAGFSAPLGIPVMRDFLFKSKDLYFSDKDKYSHFSQVFETINKISVTKNYYSSDLFNIEEILSIIEMNVFLDGNKLNADFIDYIKDVIEYYTPAIGDIEEFPGNWYDFIFGRNQAVALYGYFVANLMNLNFEKSENDNSNSDKKYKYCAVKDPNSSTKYSVLSLNYDMVLESIADAIDSRFTSENKIAFEKKSYDPDWNLAHLAKLHGCVSENEIVPPTWAKGTHPSIVPTWRNAFKVLREANHIRFIGYSLPEADSYIKYLLKAAVVDAPHLKSIDVICLDGDGSTKERYDQFFEFSNYKFKSGSVTEYFKTIKDLVKSRRLSHKDHLRVSFLEEAHFNFMN